MKKSLLVCFCALVIGTVLCWLYVHSASYVIVVQKSYTVSSTSEVTKGLAVHSFHELGSALSKYGLEVSELEGDFGRVDFGKTFVFISENGRLLEISHGFSGFDVAALQPSTNLNVAVVRGPRSRPLKAVTRQ